MKTVAIVGAGKVGRTLGRLLRKGGWRIGDVACRSMAHARAAVRFIGAGRATVRPDLRGASLVLVAVPDDAVAKVAKKIRPDRGAFVVHTSGVLPSSILRGSRRASIHPMRSFADPAKAAREFRGTFCFYEGNIGAKKIIHAIGGRSARLSTKGKGLYHAGAVFASNYVVTVLAEAAALMRRAGIRNPWPAVLSLAEGTMRNVRSVGVPDALTGPIERGDLATVRRHYAALGRATVGVARAKRSISARTAVKLLGVLA